MPVALVVLLLVPMGYMALVLGCLLSDFLTNGEAGTKLVLRIAPWVFPNDEAAFRRAIAEAYVAQAERTIAEQRVHMRRPRTTRRHKRWKRKPIYMEDRNLCQT